MMLGLTLLSGCGGRGRDRGNDSADQDERLVDQDNESTDVRPTELTMLEIEQLFRQGGEAFSEFKLSEAETHLRRVLEHQEPGSQDRGAPRQVCRAKNRRARGACRSGRHHCLSVAEEQRQRADGYGSLCADIV